MPIQVTCPGCLKRFQVNDKFAGKTGPCPSCSKPITIPSKNEEVVIHSPENEGPKDSKGRPVFKPIQREEARITLPMALTAGGLSLISLVVALAVRFTSDEPPTALLMLGTILLAPPLVLFGYWFLRDDELDGFHGKELIIRTAILSVIFMVTWGIYAVIPKYVGSYESLAKVDLAFVAIVVPIMIVLGAVASILTMELEGLQGVLHYLLYFAVTLTLALIMRTPLAQPFAREGADKGAVKTSAPNTPSNTPPNKAAPPAGTATPPTPPGKAPPAAQPQTKAGNAKAPTIPVPGKDGKKKVLQ